MSIDVYEQIPVMESEKFLLREIKDEDAKDLLKVYSDVNSVPIFNSDNCMGDFYITTMQDINRMIDFWRLEYQNRYYVRWAIIDKKANCAIGSIELFNRKAKDYFNNCGLLRLDLRSDYENQDMIEDILKIIIPKTKEMFACEIIATKAVSIAKERIIALEKMDFRLSEEVLVGHDGTKYDSYYVWRCRKWLLILRKNIKNFTCQKNQRLLMFQRLIILRLEEKGILMSRMASTNRQSVYCMLLHIL